MSKIQITVANAASIPEFEQEIKNAGGTVTESSGNVLTGEVPDAIANVFIDRIRNNPRAAHDESNVPVGTFAVVEPPPPDPRDIALAELKKAHGAHEAALAQAQTDLTAAHAAREAAEASEEKALQQVADLKKQLADAEEAATKPAA